MKSKTTLMCLADGRHHRVTVDIETHGEDVIVHQWCDNYWFGIKESGVKMEGEVSWFKRTVGTLLLNEKWSQDHNEVWDD